MHPLGLVPFRLLIHLKLHDRLPKRVYHPRIGPIDVVPPLPPHEVPLLLLVPPVVLSFQGVCEPALSQLPRHLRGETRYPNQNQSTPRQYVVPRGKPRFYNLPHLRNAHKQKHHNGRRAEDDQALVRHHHPVLVRVDVVGGGEGGTA